MTTSERNKLKTRQICFVFLAMTPVTKLTLLPSVLAKYAGEQLWFSALINFALDGAVLLSILLLGKKHPKTTVYDVVRLNLGQFWAKAVYSIYALYFFLKAFIPLLEQQDYVQNTLYEVTPNVITFLPFFIVSTYACLTGMKILGRCADVNVWVFFTAIALVFYLSLSSGDYSNLLPIIQKPGYKPLNASLNSLVWFSDGVYALLFLGHFENEKRDRTKIVGCFLAQALIVCLFLAVFFAVFGPVAEAMYLAVPQMTIFSVTVANIARFDYLAVFLLLFSQVLAAILPIYLSSKCLEVVLGTKKSILPALVVNVILAALLLIFSNKLFSVFQVIKKYFVWFFIAFGYILPPLLLLIPKRRVNDEN